MKINKILLCSLLFSITATCFTQNLPKVLPSLLVKDVNARSTSNPKIEASELAAYANGKLKQNGYGFEVDPCDLKTETTKISFPGDDGGVFHIYRLKNSAGGYESFMAREPGDAPCGCWLNLPVTKAGKSVLNIVADKSVLSVQTPKDLIIEDVELVDISLRKIVRKWLVPQGGGPDAISTDGLKLYFETGIDALYIEITEDGSLQFVPKSSLTIISKHTDLKKFPHDPNNAYLSFRKFSNGKRLLIVKFSEVCA